ncbi:MAG: SLATT domain-containing protein [Chthoniobacterales bacterium]
MSNIPLYAQGTYDRELNYKLWSTYKSRFNAASRLRKKHELSTRAVSLLSAYVMIFSLITTMLPQFSLGSTSQVILFISSALSIIILVVSQLEASQNYSVRAYTFHQSGLQIAELYKELRALKTRYGNEKGSDFLTSVENLSKRYDDILQRSDNHDDVDFACFRASKPNYDDHALSKWDVFYTHASLFTREYLFYYMCMAMPPLLFALFAYFTFPVSK